MKRLASLLFVAVLTACSRQDDAKFLGRWEQVDRPTTTVTIERNGDEFLVSEASSVRNIRTGAPKIARFQDGKLVITPNAYGAAITYVEARDGLVMSSTWGSAEYQRAK